LLADFCSQEYNVFNTSEASVKRGRLIKIRGSNAAVFIYPRVGGDLRRVITIFTARVGGDLNSIKKHLPMGYVYILASKKDGVLYIGATYDLQKRIYEHRNRFVKGFTYKYWTHKLVYYEVAESVESAFYREKQLKKWNRDWKLRVINEFNPEWKDLYDTL
jgi:putative endonuclease